MIELNIREATDRDSKAIRDLIFNIWINEHGFNVQQEDYPDLYHIEKHYQSTGLFLVAEMNHQIIGTIAYEQLNKNQFVLKRMFVYKNYRKQGIAKKLLDTILSHLKNTVLKQNISIYLSTKSLEAKAAKAFYLRSGFREINRSELPEGFPFFYEDDFFMALSFPEKRNLL